MKKLFFASVIVFFAAGILFGLLTFLGIEKAIAVSSALLPFSGITYVHQVLEKGEIKPNLRALPKGVVTLQGFALPWYQMLVYGTLIFVAVKQFGGLLAGLAIGLAGISIQDGLFVVAVIANLVTAAGLYLMGVWIGTRCSKYSFLVAIAMPFFGQIIGATIDFLILSESQFSNTFGQPKSFGFFLTSVIVSTLLVVIFAVFGVWRGSRARLSAYLSYLLGNLPADTRNTIINLAYEEVKELSSNQVKKHPPASSNELNNDKKPITKINMWYVAIAIAVIALCGVCLCLTILFPYLKEYLFKM